MHIEPINVYYYYMAVQHVIETIIEFFSKASVFGADKLFSQVHTEGQKGNNTCRSEDFDDYR